MRSDARGTRGKVVPLYPRDPDPPSRQISIVTESGHLYEFAASRSLATLQAQHDEFSATITRAVQVIAFLGAATSFLISTTLGGVAAVPENRAEPLFQVLLFLGCTMAFLAILLLVSLLTNRPGRLRSYETTGDVRFKREWKLRFMFDLRGDMLASFVLNPTGNARSSAAYFELVTQHARRMELYNEVHLASVRFRYRLFVLAVLLQLVAWVILAVRYG